ncbi:MAG: twin-arginine translocase subunit TatC [Bacteroidetes bacterium]|nr:twin-arginine translocase subunit TatC [Bacteroidota bacterium]
MIGKDSSGNPEAEMGFFDHVEALRWHLIRSVIAIVLSSSLVGVYYEFVFNKIILGIQFKDFPTYRLMCWVSTKLPFLKDICIDKDMVIPLLNTSLFGQITLLFQYSIIIGLVISFPYLIWELWRFVAPALKPEEQKKVGKVILGSSGFFFLGVTFSYFVIIPFSVNFAVNFSISPSIKNNFTIDNYIDFFTVMLLAIGAVFEMPVIVYFLSKLGILKSAIMRKSRRYAILVIVIVAGIITPSPDVFTQCLVAVPIYILFEFSIFIAARNEKKREKELNVES